MQESVLNGDHILLISKEGLHSEKHFSVAYPIFLPTQDIVGVTEIPIG